MTSQTISIILASLFLGVCLWFARRAKAQRRRRQRRLEIELRLTTALESFHKEVLRFDPAWGIKAKRLSANNQATIPSNQLSSLRYIQGHRDED